LTTSRSALYSEAMSTDKARELLEQELKRLEGRIEELVATCRKLRSDNGSLRERLESLTTERAGLLAKNEHVRTRVEAMISRLKALEENA
jgi:cell division protein ZapB